MRHLPVTCESKSFNCWLKQDECQRVGTGVGLKQRHHYDAHQKLEEAKIIKTERGAKRFPV